MASTLLDKAGEAHTVRTRPSGQTQLLIGLHLIHEVTTPQAFQMLKELKLKVRVAERTLGTLDHTTPHNRPKPPPPPAPRSPPGSPGSCSAATPRQGPTVRAPCGLGGGAATARPNSAGGGYARA